MPQDPPKKGKPPSGRPETETPDVTSSQILSTRDLGESAPPLPARGPRRSSTHGVGWYATEDDDELALPVRGKRSKTIFFAALLAVLLGGLAGAYVWSRTRPPPVTAAPLVAEGVATTADAAPPAPDAAPVRTARLSLTSTPPGAELVVDGKPIGKAPAEIDVPEASTVVVEATLAEHEPWREEVAVAAKDRKVTARLVPIPVDAGPPADATVPAVEPAPEKPVKKVSKAAAKKVVKKKATATKSKAKGKTKARPKKPTTTRK